MTTKRHKLFGTDGIRGLANRFPMNAEVALQVGAATARVLLKRAGGTKRTHCVRRRHVIEGIRLGRGAHRLTLTCSGKNEKSEGYMAGIDTITLRP